MYVASSDYAEPDGHQPVAQSLRESLEDLLYVSSTILSRDLCYYDALLSLSLSLYSMYDVNFFGIS